MDERPHLFANMMVRQLVDHATGGTVVVRPADFLTLRLVYRYRGGTWEALQQGDPSALALLKGIVRSWVAMPGRPTVESEYV